MLVGYARISTREQSMDGQLDSLHHAGCDKVFTEVASGAREDRPVLREALEYARPGDVLVCFKLDRVARSLPHLTNLVADLDLRQIGLRSLTEEIDTGTPVDGSCSMCSVPSRSSNVT